MCLVAGGGVTGPERSEAGTFGWIESESCLDAGRNSFGLPNDDSIDGRRLSAAAEAHRHVGLAAVTGEHYEGGHWLGSFAVYLMTRRGIPSEESGERE